MRAAAITGAAFVFPVVIFDVLPYPFLLVSYPVLLASLWKCSAQSPDRSTYPDLVQLILYPPNFQQIPQLRRPVFYPLGYQEVSGLTFQFPHVRLVLQLVLKLSNM